MPRRQSLLDDKVKPTVLYVQGISQESFLDKLRDKVSIPVTIDKPDTISKESMQEDGHNERQAILSLFVYKPKQTGFAATAAMTQAAIQNPESTVIAVLNGDKETPEDRVEREGVQEVLAGTNAPIFDNENEAIDYVNQAVDEGIQPAEDVVQ